MKSFNLNHAIAISVLFCTGVLVAIPASSSAAAGNTGQGDVVRMLDEKRVRLQDVSGSATEAINVLRHKYGYGVPVSFISVADEKPQTAQFRDEVLTLREALDQFVRTREGYIYSLVGDHLMVYPKSGPFKKVIGEVNIRNTPRLEATEAFVEHLKRTDAEFGNLIRPGIKGDPRAPVYTDRVSLPEEATVLEHLAALLGDNPNVTFSILDGPRSGTRLFILEQGQRSEANRMLDERRVGLQDMSGSTTEAIDVLRHKYGVPVSFISVADEKPVAVQLRDEWLTLREALDEFVRTREGYTYALVADRLVVYPKSGPFEKVIGQVGMRNTPRLEAIAAFVEHLKRTHAEFGNLAPGGFVGNPQAPLYAEPISLPEEATVLEHLVALLGDNPSVIFSILDDLRPGTRVFVLGEVKSSEAKRPAAAKDDPAP